MSLDGFTDEQILMELLSRQKPFDAPNQVTYCSPHQEFIVGIGNDHSVAIIIAEDSLEELKSINESLS